MNFNRLSYGNHLYRLDRLVYNDSIFKAGHSGAEKIPVIADFTTAITCMGAWNDRRPPDETASRFRERARRTSAIPFSFPRGPRDPVRIHEIHPEGQRGMVERAVQRAMTELGN